MTKFYQRLVAAALLLLGSSAAWAQEQFIKSKFDQLETILPTPNTYRTASGAPGHQYWQQRADYVITVELDDEKQRITGSETITYTNNSPDVLTYLWLQLDQNQQAKTSDSYSTATQNLKELNSFSKVQNLLDELNFDGGYQISKVADAKTGQALRHTINKTMMRVELPTPMRPGSVYSFNINWAYNINDQVKLGGRSGYEYFKADGNYLYEIAQFFPRMAVYSDYQGWNHKQFLGGGEFASPFGNYNVSITVPNDHVLGATGELQNPTEVLSVVQQQRWAQAKTASKPTLIVTQDEAAAAEKGKPTGKKTWKFAAKNVRDFAFATSRKFIWDAMAVKVGANNIMAMSLYPKEGNPLWGQYSTEAVAHTLRVYSKFSFDYPYPVAYSVHGPIFGMEYPMICFNGGRPEADGTYTPRIKYGLISVVIHEVGHNFFPMIVNSDERQWAWMDEGLNSFLQYLAEQEWERDYPSRRGVPAKMVAYMVGDKQNPIMTNSESVSQLGNNAYGKPATALNILRETVMGRELFDYSFKEYSRRWMFKHPSPADFFRTMEDASAVDLDWFWRGWFYTTDHVDIAIENVTAYQLDTQDPSIAKADKRAARQASTTQISSQRNRSELKQVKVEENPAMQDYYNTHDSLDVKPWEVQAYQRYTSSLTPEEKALIDAGYYFYQIDFRNVGGLVMPVILEFSYQDGSKEVVRIPAEVWRLNTEQFSKVFILKKPVQQVLLDPYAETADADGGNNVYPRKAQPTRFQLFKQNRPAAKNPMQLEREQGSGAGNANTPGQK